MLLPYMKMFLRRECPCRSQNKTISLSFWNDRTMRLTLKITGCKTLFGIFHRRFKSWPDKEQRQFPLMTPSGFRIGIILKTKLSLSALASGLLDMRQSITPFIIQDALLSPGCTLALIIIPFLASALALLGSLSLLVIDKYSHLFPAKVLHRVPLQKKSWQAGSFSILVRSS